MVRRPGGQAAVGRLDALGLEHRGDELAEDDRLVIGDEVGLAGRPLSAASSIPSTTLSTWAVSVTLPPPPIHAHPPCFDRGDHPGSRVVSPFPQTKRGLTVTVSNPPRFARRTASSARALVAE